MDPTPPITPPAYKDRSTGLLVFGILEILLGLFFALAVPIGMFSQFALAKKNGVSVDSIMLVSAALTPAMLAIGLIWLGIGSINARRWARALLLCFGWMGLCCGVVALVVVLATLGSLDETMRAQGAQVTPAVIAITKAIMIATIAFIYVLIPGALVLFYRSEHVRKTCERRDPVERWTDRCPLPVVAMCVLQAFGGIYLLLMPRFGAAIPVAGAIVTGWTARLLWLGFIAVSLYSAWGFYRLDRRAWLIYTAMILVLGISNVVTFLRVDLVDYYRALGMPAFQVEQIARSPIVRGPFVVAGSVVSLGFFGGFLLYLRRYFVAAKEPMPTAGAPPLSP